MSTRRTSAPAEFTITTNAADQPGVFATAFNSGDPALLARVYEDGAVFVPESGAAVTGPELHAANAAFLALGLPVTVRPRHCHVAGELALHIVDWSITGVGPDGEPLHITGTATDVSRRGPDGFWRYVIDNPFGTMP
ncbi:YybH family protein [Yinghuangia sp. YIM S09857]|uniref:YybH family protein n=1 Tax=Yinghuangia sp. YIM S09857 TaxID=3436929 RepID=UPI003F53C09F